jgi:predicted RNA methylase
MFNSRLTRKSLAIDLIPVPDQMPRALFSPARLELILAPGMSVADGGAGRGEMVALAAELGPSGRVHATDIAPEALEQIRTRVAAAELPNVTSLRTRARDTGLPTSCAVTPASWSRRRPPAASRS